MYYPKSQNRKNVEENKVLLNWKKYDPTAIRIVENCDYVDQNFLNPHPFP